MNFPFPVSDATLLRRYKRFLADVLLEDGRKLTVHCANPGSMQGVSEVGSPVLVCLGSRPGSKLPGSLEAIRVDDQWVGIHPSRANRVVEEALLEQRIAPLAGWGLVRREPAWPEGGRADFQLAHRDGRLAWLEVKNVTLTRGDLALFPDAETTRGVRHLECLRARVAAGERAVLLFAVARGDVERVGPADGIDPAYGDALRTAAGEGVEILGYRMRVDRAGLTLTEAIPLDLGPHLLPTRVPEPV